MSRKSTLVLALMMPLVIVGCAKQPPAPAAYRPEEPAVTIAWGEEVNGLQAGLSFKGMSKEPKTTVTLVLHLRNASERPVRILRLSSQAMFWGECLPLEVRVAGALRKYRGPVLEPPPPPAESEYIYLQPGATDAVEVTMFPGHWKLAPPTEAEIIFVFENRLLDVEDLWMGVARSGAIRVKMGS